MKLNLNAVAIKIKWCANGGEIREMSIFKCRDTIAGGWGYFNPIWPSALTKGR